MKKNLPLILTLCLIFLLSGCNSDGGNTNSTTTEPKESGDTKWSYGKTISTPVKANTGTGDTKLGTLSENTVEVSIPGKALNSPKEITITNPEKVPKVMGKEFTPMGAPVEITMSGDGTRMEEPVSITFKLDKEKIGDSIKKPGDFWGSYYDGSKWAYLRPTKVDLTAETITFETYHFSLFGYGKLTVDEQVSQFTHSKAVGEWGQENVDKRLEEASNKIIDHILVEKLGIKDESTKMKVLGNLLKNDEWGEIVRKAKDGDVTGVNENIQILAGKTIVDFVPKSALKGALEHLTSNLGVETVKKAAEAAGNLAAGNYTDAAKIIGEHIGDQFVLTQAGRVAVAAIQNRIDTWKSAELEAAFKVYQNGASSKVPFWGYQVEKGNFDEVWGQMKGAARQVVIDAISEQEKIRKEAGMPPLTDVEKERFKEVAKNALKDSFERRAKEEAAVAEKEKEIKAIIQNMKDNNLITPGEWGYPSDYFSVDQRLTELFHFKDKVLRDTGRTGLTDGAFSNNANINYADLVELTKAWYTVPDGKKQYALLLKSKYGIDLFPTPEQINGTWTGPFYISDVVLPPIPSTTPAPGAKADPDDPLAGCDSSFDLSALFKQLEAMKGTTKTENYLFKLDKDGNGTLMVYEKSKGGQKDTLNTTYSSGSFKASGSQNKMGIDIEGTISSDGKIMTLEANWKISFNSKSSTWYGLKGTIKSKKAIPVKKTDKKDTTKKN